MLKWSTIGNELEKSISQDGRRLRLLVCPFIQRDALKRLLEKVDDVDCLQVITRWNASDLVSGVSDIEVYPYLRGLNVPLFVHSRIHLKLYVFDDGAAFLGSGNLTQTGLGWGGRANVEVGCFVPLDDGDWAHVSRILQDSCRVNQEVYEAASAFKSKHAIHVPAFPNLALPFSGTGGFSLLDLPIAISPDALVESITSIDSGGSAALEVMHDMHLLALDAKVHGENLKAQILSNYRELQAVQALVRWLGESGSRSFGEVTQWMHSRLIDRPVPYRTDVKAAVANMYRWLPKAFERVTVDRPNHSEVLFFR